MKKLSRKQNWDEQLKRSTLETLKPEIRKRLPRASYWLKNDQIPDEIREQLKNLLQRSVISILRQYRVSPSEVAFAVLHFLHPQSKSVKVVSWIKDINDTLRSDPPAHLVNNFKNLLKLKKTAEALMVKWGFRYPGRYLIIEPRYETSNWGTPLDSCHRILESLKLIDVADVKSVITELKKDRRKAGRLPQIAFEGPLRSLAILFCSKDSSQQPEKFAQVITTILSTFNGSLEVQNVRRRLKQYRIFCKGPAYGAILARQ